MENKVDIFFCVIEERLLQSSFDLLIRKMPEKIRARIQRFIRWEDAHACLVGYLLIERFVLKENQSLDYLQTNQFGKPYLDNGPFFNVTHSGRLIALAAAKFEIGIDAEFIQEYDFLSLIDEFTSEKEKKRILYSKNPLKEFYHYWTQKEACIKQVGKGLSTLLKSFEISNSGITYVEDNKLKLLNVKTPLKDYIINLAVPHDLFDDSIEFAINTSFVNVLDLGRG